MDHFSALEKSAPSFPDFGFQIDGVRLVRIWHSSLKTKKRHNQRPELSFTYSCEQTQPADATNPTNGSLSFGSTSRAYWRFTPREGGTTTWSNTKNMYLQFGWSVVWIKQRVPQRRHRCDKWLTYKHRIGWKQGRDANEQTQQALSSLNTP